MNMIITEPIRITDLQRALSDAAQNLYVAADGFHAVAMAEQAAEAELKDRQQELVATGAISGKNEAERTAQLHQQTEPERQKLRNIGTAAANARFALERAQGVLAAMRDQLRIAEMVARADTAAAATHYVQALPFANGVPA